MCKRLTQIFLTFLQDAGQVNSRTSFYEQFEWKRSCESELDKYLSYQPSDITCADLILMKKIYCSRSFGLAQHIEVRRLIWTSGWHLTFQWTDKPVDLQVCPTCNCPTPPPPPSWREPTANVMIEFRAFSWKIFFFNQQTASHNDVEAQSSELSEVEGSKPVLNSTYFWF